MAERSKWPMVKLGEVCDIVGGSTPKTAVSAYWGNGYYWVTPAELNDSTRIIYSTERTITKKAVDDTNLKVLPIGSVLLSSRAPIGKVAITGAEMYCNQGFKNLICSKQLYNKYLYWYLKGKTDYLNSLGRGATFKEISKTIVSNIEIPLPPIEVQREIARVLDAAAELTKLHKNRLTELDVLIQSVFYDMFGDPVTNEKGWEISNFDLSFNIIDGDRGVNYPKHEEMFDEGYCIFLNTGNVTKSGFNFENIKYIDQKKHEKLRSGYVHRHDIIMTTRGTVGNVAYYDDNIPHDIMRINSGMVILRAKNKINSQYFVSLTRMNDYKNKILSFLSGSAQPQLPITNMKKIPIPIPPLSLQQKFASIVEKIEAEKALARKGIEESQYLFDSLMAEYF